MSDINRHSEASVTRMGGFADQYDTWETVSDIVAGDLEVNADFVGYMKNFRMDERSGELVLIIGIPLVEKDYAWAMTDKLGIQQRFLVVSRIPVARARVPDDEE
jgi:hypothetical protein